MDISLSDLRSFVLVADLQSFHKAALILNISPTALTRRIQRLEAMLDVALFDRTTRRVSLSVVGRDLLPRAQHLVDELDISLLSVKDIAERTSGQVTIACVPTAAFYFLPEVISAFSVDFPRIKIKIIDEGANIVLRSVLQGEADIGINMLGGNEPDIVFEPLLVEPFVLACLRDHPLAELEEVRWSQLAPYKVIVASRSSGNRLLLDHALTERPKSLYEVQHLTTALGMVEAGIAIASLPQMTIPKAAGHIVTSRPLVDPVVTRTIGIIRRRGSHLSPSASSFYELIKSRWPA